MDRPTLTRLSATRHLVDRDAGRRTQPDLFDRLLADPATRILPLRAERALMTAPGSAALALLRPDEVTAALTRVYLGTVLDDGAGMPVIAEVLTEAAALELRDVEECWVGLRQAAPRLSDRDLALLTEAVAITNWHQRTPNCPRCGTPTVVESGGWVRRCFVDGGEVFPRTDPAVIMRVLDDDDRLLLGSNAMWEHNRWSLLAGFVEPGESFEAAVQREVEEESGLRVRATQYLGSQPWPYPSSVMVGMEARLASGQQSRAPRPDGKEIVGLRWFSRADLWSQRGEILLPGEASIAHAIVQDWYGAPLAEPPRR